MESFQNLISRTAAELDAVEKEFPASGEIEVCPVRLHSDFGRGTRGQPAQFSETAPALRQIQAELDALGFTPSRESRFRRSARFGLAGEVDAHGEIQGLSAIIELKVVDKIPAVPRAQDAAQILLYDLLFNGGIGGTVLAVVYVQNHSPFRAESRIVADPIALAPLVTELLS